jgi:hypothetical protein
MFFRPRKIYVFPTLIEVIGRNVDREVGVANTFNVMVVFDSGVRYVQLGVLLHRVPKWLSVGTCV